MDFIKENNTRMKTNSDIIDEKPKSTNDPRSSLYLKNIPTISLKKIENSVNSIERNSKKIKNLNRVNFINSPSLEGSNRNILSYTTQQSTSKKIYTMNIFSPIDNNNTGRSSIFMHLNNQLNKVQKIKNTPPSYNNKIVSIFMDNAKTMSIDDKNNTQYNKIMKKVSLEPKNSNPKNYKKKRIDINLPNPRNKYKLFNSSNMKINNSIGDERLTNQIKEIPTMMINNRIKLHNDENMTNSGSFKNSLFQENSTNLNHKKHKDFAGKTGFMCNNRIYVSNQNKKKINKKNNNGLLMSNDNIFKHKIKNIVNNKNLLCISLDAKKNNTNISNSIERNKEQNNFTLKLKNFNIGSNKSIVFGTENKKKQERNKKFDLIIKNKHKKNLKIKLFLTNKNKKIENTKTKNMINNIKEKNYVERTQKKNKAPQTIKKLELEKKVKNLKNESQKNNNIYLNKTYKQNVNRYYNIENNLTDRSIKSVKEEEKVIDERGENHEDNDTFDNTTQLYNHSSITHNFQITNKNFYNMKNIIYYKLLKSISSQYNLVEKVIKYLDYESLNKICLISKNYYNIVKPIIYEKIYKKISKLNKKCAKIYKTEIKKSLLNISKLTEMSKMLLQKKYMDLLYENNCKYDIEIKKDLTRTLPENESFNYGNKNYNKLYHILTAYSNYNKNIGYAQGLNFIAAKCIYVFENEIEEFIFFDAMVQKFNLAALLGVNNNLKIKLKEINFFLEKYTPKIKSYLENFDLNYDFFTANWMLTLLSISMENYFLFYVWDYMIVFGWKFFKCFIVAVVKKNENEILKQSQSNLTYFMKNILRDEKFNENFENIISLSFEYMIKENMII